MTITYTQGSLKIRTTTGTHTINATVASNGLAYHQTYYGAHDIGPDYSVSQVSTGWGLSEETEHFQTPEQCQRFIELADPLADWTKSMSELFGRFKNGKAKERWIKKMRADLEITALKAMAQQLQPTNA